MPGEHVQITLQEMLMFVMGYTQDNHIIGEVEEIGMSQHMSEYVYRWQHMPNFYTLLYTSIGLNKSSFAVGHDAIRVVFHTYVNKNRLRLKTFGKQRRVHRVVNWRFNLTSRLDTWQSVITPLCPACGNYTVIRTNRRDNSAFYGCMAYQECKQTVTMT